MYTTISELTEVNKLNLLERIFSAFALFCMMVGIGDLVFHISLILNPDLKINHEHARYYIAMTYAVFGFLKVEALPRFNNNLSLWDIILGKSKRSTHDNGG